MRETRLELWVWKIPRSRERLPTPGFSPGEFHGEDPGELLHGTAESDTTQRLTLSLFFQFSLFLKQFYLSPG